MEKVQISKEKEIVGPMFDSIAWRYDFLNRILSFGIDRKWRRRAIEIISASYDKPAILDVATGTADLAIAAVAADPRTVKGIDISEKMLELGRRKIREKGFSELIELINSDSESICFADESFDVAMVAFGVRNFSDPVIGLTEMRRVVRKGGLVLILEFSKPEGTAFRSLYDIYFRHFLPSLGGLFSGNRKAYKYLHRSVTGFADSEEFMQLMREAGLTGIRQERLTRGIATIYTGIRG